MLQRSTPEHYRIADFISWDRQRQLRLNPDFQRRYIWTQDVKSYFIDTILSGYPIPKVYIRTEIDPKTHGVLRDVVDGQQRIRTILDFAKGDLRLNKRAGEHRDLRWEDLPSESQTDFLAYQITAEQLIEASDEDVLEMFARLNTYSVPLSPAEKRHARYQGEFKFAVREVAQALAPFWEDNGILSTRERLRMLDDQLTAELLGILVDGLSNGGAPYIDGLYKRFDKEFPESSLVIGQLHEIVSFMEEEFKETITGNVFSRPPQFLILFAALAHSRIGLKQGDYKGALPPRVKAGALDLELARSNLARLSNAVTDSGQGGQEFPAFATASRGATVRIDGRQIRFDHVWRAVKGEL